jgi:hypothetical protein
MSRGYQPVMKPVSGQEAALSVARVVNKSKSVTELKKTIAKVENY